MELQQEPDQKPQDLQPRVSRQRVQHIVDSYLLTGNEPRAFETYLHDLLDQYPPGLIELALVETLIRNWLTIPMQKGVPFLAEAHKQVKQWQIKCRRQDLQNIDLTHSQFRQITGLDPDSAFAALEEFRSQLALTATESSPCA